MVPTVGIRIQPHRPIDNAVGMEATGRRIFVERAIEQHLLTFTPQVAGVPGHFFHSTNLCAQHLTFGRVQLTLQGIGV